MRIFDVNGSRLGQPAGGWPATVVKVGTKLVTLRRVGRSWRDEVFRIEEQTKNNDWGHESFLTLAQVAEKSERTRAVETMRAHGITIHSSGGSIPTEKLVAVARTLATFDVTTPPKATIGERLHRQPARPRS